MCKKNNMRHFLHLELSYFIDDTCNCNGNSEFSHVKSFLQLSKDHSSTCTWLETVYIFPDYWLFKSKAKDVFKLKKLL